ncbi:MAG: Asp23/Gls24 family envelope stress response protein [Clostridia bacterium]|nr:Asp23/Gls24 family envelope stress response protein [Clostridia bacterium]
MATENEIVVSNGIDTTEGGKVVFATDVIATIANLAATEIDGVVSMSGSMVEDISGILSSKKGLTKGVKVEIEDDTTAVDLSVVVKYGYKLQEVCKKAQDNVKNAIEMMTGLKVKSVNISVQSIVFEKETNKE